MATVKNMQSGNNTIMSNCHHPLPKSDKEGSQTQSQLDLN